MTRVGLARRLAAIEASIPAAGPDVAAEARRFGVPRWTCGEWRAYAAQRAGCAVLTLAGPAGSLAYELPGLDVGDVA